MSAPRRWFQFSLKTLLLLTVVCALAVTWWLHWKQSAELAAAQQKLQRLERDAQFQNHANRVFRALDMQELQHRKAFDTLRRMNPFWPLTTVQQQQVGESQDDLEVLLFHANSMSVPGSEESLVVLMRGQILVDLIHRESDLRWESHAVYLDDVDSSRKLAVVLDYRPRLWGKKNEPFRLIYGITNTGFAAPQEEKLRK